MNTATQEQIVKSHARAKVADAISEVASTTDNKLTITTSILFNDFPCVTNYGFYGTDNYDVYAIRVTINTEVNCGSEYTEPGVSHYYRINYKTILRNGAIGSLTKKEITHRTTLSNMIGEVSVTQLEQSNVKQLMGHAKNMLNIMEAYK
jgi:hypothetical protein